VGMQLEVVVLPVADVERAEDFDGQLGLTPTFPSINGFRVVLAGAMHRAPAAHGEHENRIGAADPDWTDWCAA
jgi:hypothetical protein